MSNGKEKSFENKFMISSFVGLNYMDKQVLVLMLLRLTHIAFRKGTSSHPKLLFSLLPHPKRNKKIVILS